MTWVMLRNFKYCNTFGLIIYLEDLLFYDYLQFERVNHHIKLDSRQSSLFELSNHTLF